MRDTQREAEAQAEGGEAGSRQRAQSGNRSRDSRITPWVKGRCPTAEPLRHPRLLVSNVSQERPP